MARTYTNVATSIWRPDNDFVNLTDNAQRVYFLLISQPDITAAGVLSLNVKRWAGKSTDGSPERIIAGLRELQAHRYVVFDEKSEEVLVRTFVKWDGGYHNSKRRPVIERAAMEVESPALRGVLADEFGRLGLRHDYLSEGTEDPIGEASTAVASRPDASDVRVPKTKTISSHKVGDPQVNTVSDTAEPFEGVVGCIGPYVEPTTHNPQPAPPSAAASVTAHASTETEGQRVNRLARTYTGRVKLSNFNAVAGVVRKAVRAGLLDDAITRGLAALAAEERAVTADTLRIAINGSRPTGPDRPGTPSRTQPRRDRHTNYAAMIGDLQGGQP